MGVPVTIASQKIPPQLPRSQHGHKMQLNHHFRLRKRQISAVTPQRVVLLLDHAHDLGRVVLAGEGNTNAVTEAVIETVTGDLLMRADMVAGDHGDPHLVLVRAQDHAPAPEDNGGLVPVPVLAREIVTVAVVAPRRVLGHAHDPDGSTTGLVLEVTAALPVGVLKVPVLPHHRDHVAAKN